MKAQRPPDSDGLQAVIKKLNDLEKPQSPRPVVEPPPSPDKGRYGGFWIRLGAYAVDCVALLIPTLLISFLFRAVSSPKTDVEQAVFLVSDNCLKVLVWWAYTTVLLSSSWQATLGKKVCGLKVVDLQGKRISFGRATGRYFAGFLSAILIGIGFFMIAWTSKRQGLHDLIAGTLVERHIDGDVQRPS